MGPTVNPFTYLGRLGSYFAADSNDYFLRRQYYRSATGRFNAPDPATTSWAAGVASTPSAGRPADGAAVQDGTRVTNTYDANSQRAETKGSAGRDGFWIHRFLTREGVQNIVVDSASIEVSRRKRQAKSDRLDALKLVSMLIRWHNGEKKVWSVVHVPTVADEDGRQLHRELIELKSERHRAGQPDQGPVSRTGLEHRGQRHTPRPTGETQAMGRGSAAAEPQGSDPPRIRAVAIGRAANPRAGGTAGTRDSHGPQAPRASKRVG